VSGGGVLALLGGEPVRRAPWPRWPEADDATAAALARVVSAGRWTVTNPTPAGRTREYEFARRFAGLYQVPYCVPVSSGSAALRLALLAAGVRPLDRVVVPGLTWAAVASAVVNAGAVPQPADVERESLCLSPAALDRVLGRSSVRPAAVVAVHQNCAVADLPALLEVTGRYGVPLIEDCSQAHGASLDGRPVGGFARAGIFSFQQNKMLTCGEGGAIITSDDRLYAALQQLRSVGREYAVAPGGSEVGLRDVGAIIGDSVVLSEFQAAVLLDQLDRFPAQHARRLANVALLERLLDGSPLVSPVTGSPPGSVRGYHKYVWRLDRAAVHGLPASVFAKALAAELGREAGVVDPAFDANGLLSRAAIAGRILPRGSAGTDALLPASEPLPEAAAARAECFHIRHDAFLGGEAEMADIATAIAKVGRHSAELALHAGQGAAT
jgi:dTDP-4-amino-4,6-dideoxygalactose transaminase